ALGAGAAAGGVRDRLPDRVCRRSWRAVRAVEPRLEAGAQAVVVEPEEVHLGDGRVARCLTDKGSVDRGLLRLARDGHVLLACVADARRGADLPADLVEIELETLHRRRLRRAVERVPETLLDAVEVGEPRVGPV